MLRQEMGMSEGEGSEEEGAEGAEEEEEEDGFSDLEAEYESLLTAGALVSAVCFARPNAERRRR